MASTRAALKKLNAFFDKKAEAIYWHSDLVELFNRHKQDWAFPQSMTAPKFIDLLLKKTDLTSIVLHCAPYPQLTRYAWKGVFPPLALALSIRRNSFLSHGSALWVHGLADRPAEIYANQEQSAKPVFDDHLTQESIDRAFQGSQRQSNLIYHVDGTVIRILAGKNTGRTDVAQYSTPDDEIVEASSPERSLIESVVRPAYSGGIPTVLRAFQSARQHISVTTLVSVLVKFDYVYPYQQAVGFYLERAGYSAADLACIERRKSPFKFYLGHGLEHPAFNDRWQVFYPRCLD